jgi:hypothetical protein
MYVYIYTYILKVCGNEEVVPHFHWVALVFSGIVTLMHVIVPGLKDMYIYTAYTQ